MSRFVTVVEDLFKSVFNLFAGVFNTIANIIGGFVTMTIHFFTSFVDLVAGTFKGLADMVGGLGRFIAGNIILIGVLAAGLVAYQRFVIQGRQPKPVTQAKKTT